MHGDGPPTFSHKYIIALDHLQIMQVITVSVGPSAKPEFDIDTSTGARGRDQPGKPHMLVRVRVDQWGAG